MSEIKEWRIIGVTLIKNKMTLREALKEKNQLNKNKIPIPQNDRCHYRIEKMYE